jgi:hypothetical protein
VTENPHEIPAPHRGSIRRSASFDSAGAAFRHTRFGRARARGRFQIKEAKETQAEGNHIEGAPRQARPETRLTWIFRGNLS